MSVFSSRDYSNICWFGLLRLNTENLIYQYVKEINGGYILGLENRSARKIRVKITVEGLDLTDTAFKGRGSSPSFYIDPKEKKVINFSVFNWNNPN